MKAKDLYDLLDSALRARMEARGFRKRRKSRLTYQKLLADKYHSVWFQSDKYGWDSYAGGKFFVSFTVSESPDVEAGARREERLNFFLTDAELERARGLQDGIVRRIPKPPESYFEGLLKGFSRSVSIESATQLVNTVRGYFEPEPTPFRRNQDFALRYWTPDDVRAWAALVEGVLPRAIEKMESWSLPKPGGLTTKT